MVRSFFIAINGRWLASYPKFQRRIGEQRLLPLGSEAGGLQPGCKVLVKFRDAKGAMVVDDGAEITSLKGAPFLKSPRLCAHLGQTHGAERTLLLYFEGTSLEARCVVHAAETDLFAEVERDDPTLRLTVFQLPPTETTLFDAEHLVEAFHARLSRSDPELYGVHAANFLDAPHILVPLFDHVLGLGSQEQMEFPALLKKVAEQMRALLLDNARGSVRIEKISRDHRSAWAEVRGDKISFLDGGVARVAGMPGSEPLAMRVGIYTVRPGIENVAEREEWVLKPYVIGDIIEVPPDSRPHNGDSPDRKRLQEAARYMLEPLTALAYLKEHPDVRVFFLHGPLVNQFLEYDEGTPNYIPCLSTAFLEGFGIRREDLEGKIRGIPTVSGRRLWNQFMAVYAYVQRLLYEDSHPVVGVVERTRGKWLAVEILERLVQDGAVMESYKIKIRDILDRYDISDDFLFGCVLTEGEFITPVTIQKNNPTKARDRWKQVVEQYPKPLASVVKTSETAFPYRVELNKAAAGANTSFVFRLLYHTSRLLPRYAFPVGLDIVDKYAKIPEWISTGVSARLAAEVLRRALRTGDPRLVSQVRQFLARTPRDFFFRPVT